MTVLAKEFESFSSPQEVVERALTQFEKDQIAISFSGAEDVVLLDIASKIVGNRFNVFSLDTGRLHEETYQYLDKVREHYNVELEVLSPDSQLVEELVKTKGLFSFYVDGHTECCGVRKIDSLERKLDGLDAWITGQRRDQAVTRVDVPQMQIDTAFSVAGHEITKFNPLANWSSSEVWDYIRQENVPYNSLHDQGYKSIGCQPCTRAIDEGEHERAGRWWWESEEDKECGLHAQNLTEINSS